MSSKTGNFVNKAINKEASTWPFWCVLAIGFFMCQGEPDLLDAITARVMPGPMVINAPAESALLVEEFNSLDAWFIELGAMDLDASVNNALYTLIEHERDLHGEDE